MMGISALSRELWRGFDVTLKGAKSVSSALLLLLKSMEDSRSLTLECYTRIQWHIKTFKYENHPSFGVYDRGEATSEW